MSFMSGSTDSRPAILESLMLFLTVVINFTSGLQLRGWFTGGATETRGWPMWEHETSSEATAEGGERAFI